MFTFSEFLGFLLVMIIVTMGFWLLIFLVGLLPYWIGGALRERMKERKAEKELNS
ncbi:MAG: hypothetical protein GX163_06505 [Bacteroidetes bacterium]|nr:hypothetical protein [Bacteroidota bacterium]